MGGLRQKKYESGEGARYMTRTRALKYLQLSLNDFRTICILKGVYPREPKNRKKAQRGASGIKTLYHRKDIQFLLHEPNIWKLREMKVIFRKVRRWTRLRDVDEARRNRERLPDMKLDHIVKERYPTFIDALRDLDDCLTLLFLFASFSMMRNVPVRIITLCRRLTVEFMHYVIAAKALRKVFISIKGYYFQVEIKGQTVTWIIPHQFVVDSIHLQEIDMRVMMDFVRFYTIMLGFVNFRLYHALNLSYPPTFPGFSAINYGENLVEQDVYAVERVSSLNVDLARVAGTIPQEEDEIDEFPMVEDQEKLEELRNEAEKVKKLKTLFKGLKFFINREVPREPVVFVVRCLGGQVSWDLTAGVGATYAENDETITHQIVDRPEIDKRYISRYYVQPQWVFDCVNAQTLLPVEKYFMGTVLPPHLSPFHSENKLDMYVPPEEAALNDPSMAEKLAQESDAESSGSEEEEEEEEEDDEDEIGDDGEDETEERRTQGVDEEVDETERERVKKRKMMSVKAGELTREDPREQKRVERQEYKLRVSMIKNKHRKLYHSMMGGRAKREKEAWLLRKKRRRFDETEKTKRKEEKKQQKLAQHESGTHV